MGIETKPFGMPRLLHGIPLKIGGGKSIFIIRIRDAERQRLGQVISDLMEDESTAG